jgi:ABC-type amino acid transport substrate-binding protein
MKTGIAIFCMVSIIITSIQAMAKDNHFTIGVEDLDYLPYYSSTGNNYQGYARELLDAFAKERGYVFDYKPLPVKRLFQSLLKHQVDFKFPDNPNWQSDLKKDSHIVYSEPAATYIDGVMVQKGKKGLGIDHLKKLGTVMGFTAWEYLARIQKGTVAISENSSFEGLLKQVVMGRVDGAYINPEVGRYQLETILKQPGTLEFDPGLPYTKSVYLLSTITHPDVINEFNEFLKTKAALVQQLKAKHGINKPF